MAPPITNYRGKTLPPGIYIGSKKTEILPWVRHQFFVLIPKDPEMFRGKTQDLGQGNRGMIVGGYATPLGFATGMGKMHYKRNARGDLKTLRKYLDLDRTPRKDVVLTRASNRGLPIDKTIGNIMRLGKGLRKNTRAGGGQNYPGLLRNLFGTSPNSNSFVQTVAEMAGVKNRAFQHPGGVDPGSKKRIDPSKFGIKKEAFMDGYDKTAGDNRRGHLPFRERTEVIVIKGDKVLLQKRDGYVEMPGGGIDSGESASQAGRREAMEEVGAKLKNMKPVGVIEARWYDGIKKTDWGLELWEKYKGSRTHFYIAELDGPLLTPTSEEGDRWYGRKWIPITEALEFMYGLKNTYGMKEYRDKQKDTIIKALIGSLQSKAAAEEGTCSCEDALAQVQEDMIKELNRTVSPEEMSILSKEAEDAFTNGSNAVNPLQAAEDVMDEADDRYKNEKKPKKMNTYANLPKQAAALIAETRLEQLLRRRDPDGIEDDNFRRKEAAHGNPEDYWIGVDLDGTLAKYNGWVSPSHIGAPIPQMVQRIQRWIREGKRVKIFTARMAGDNGTARKAIHAWTKKHIGTELQVTNVKDQYCTRIWDDKAVGVKANTGKQRSVGPGKW